MRYLLCLLLITACSDDTPQDDRCGGACNPGFVCASTTADEGFSCRQVCEDSLDCDEALPQCREGLCVDGEPESPVIQFVDGTGTTDGRSGYTDHRLSRWIVITGQELEGASVEVLRADTQLREELQVCSRAADRLEAILPEDLPAGDHTLTVAAQGGQCSATLPIMQGETGDTGAQGVAGNDGAPGVPCVGCVDTASVSDGAVTASKVARSEFENAFWVPGAYARVADAVGDPCTTDPCTVSSAHNVASASRISQGLFELTFSTPAQNTDYFVFCTIELERGSVSVESKSTGSVQVRLGPGATQDDVFACIIYGDF